ncbi:hypothetical protein BDB01DRAFT_396253 [Pilobolus umbonatus]|nr:hypothetical protein BDB01DRAFT_396253 [Pilobolus umbonatus]
MNRSPTEDAFLRTLDSKPRQLHSTQSHRDGQQSEVNRLSRVFENPYSPPKPIQPTKSPVSIPIREETIDTTPIAFNDIRAKFQEKTIMNRPPMTKPTYKPPAPVTFSKTGPSSNRSEKIIVAARTGPPALPIKPKPPTPNRHTSHDDISNRHTSHDDISNRHPSPPHPPPKFKSSPTILSRTATGNSSILSTTSSHSSQSKKAWHISQWFATPEEDNSLKQSIVRVSVPLSPQVSGPPMQKRLKPCNRPCSRNQTYAPCSLTY